MMMQSPPQSQPGISMEAARQELFSEVGLASITSLAIGTPFLVASTNILVAAEGARFSAIRTWRDIWNRPGDKFRGIYKGFVPGAAFLALTLGISVPCSIAAVNVVRSAKATGDEEQLKQAKAIGNLLSTAGPAAALLMHPLNVVQTRLMLDRAQGPEKYYKGTWDCLRRIVREEGAHTLWRGLMPGLWGAIVGFTVGTTAIGISLALDVVVQSQYFTYGAMALGGASVVMASMPFSIASKQFQVWNAKLPSHMRPAAFSEEELAAQPRTFATIKRNFAQYGARRGLFRGLLVTMFGVLTLKAPHDLIKRYAKTEDPSLA